MFYLAAENFREHAVRLDGEIVHILHHVEECSVVSRVLLIRLAIVEKTSRLFLWKRFPKLTTTPRRKLFTVIAAVSLQWTALSEDVSMRPSIDVFDDNLEFVCNLRMILSELLFVHFCIFHYFLNNFCLLLLDKVVFIGLTINLDLGTATRNMHVGDRMAIKLDILQGGVDQGYYGLIFSLILCLVWSLTGQNKARNPLCYQTPQPKYGENKIQ